MILMKSMTVRNRNKDKNHKFGIDCGTVFLSVDDFIECVSCQMSHNLRAGPRDFAELTVGNLHHEYS